MNRTKQLLIVFRLIIGLLIPSSVSAAEFTDEGVQGGGYDFRDDPFLLEWTFAVSTNEEQTTEPTHEEKILSRWKEKQAYLWAKLEKGRKFTVNASAYTAAADECGKSDGITASGLKVAEGRTLACPPSYPFGAKISIAGVGVLRCEDRGGAIKGNHVDIYMVTKSDAFAFGRRNLEAEVVD